MARFQSAYKYFCLVIITISFLQIYILFSGEQLQQTEQKEIDHQWQPLRKKNLPIFYPSSGGLRQLTDQVGNSNQNKLRTHDKANELRDTDLQNGQTYQSEPDQTSDVGKNKEVEKDDDRYMFRNQSDNHKTTSKSNTSAWNNQTFSGELMNNHADWEVKYTLSAKAKSWYGNKSVFPITLNSDYLIKPVNLCGEEQLDYLVVVNSALKNFLRRQAIRQTYGQQHIGQVRQKVVFLLGTAVDETTPAAIKEEAKEYNDVVQGPFVDHYRNLTHKGVMGLRWISEFCPRVKMVFKIDDDSFLNVFKIMSYLLPEYSNKIRHIGCQLHPKGIRRINRAGKWKVDETDLFRNETFYPFDRCNGFFVFVTGDLIPLMFSAARINPYFWIDDAYVFGMLPETVGNVTHINIWRDLSIDYAQGRDCIMKEGPECHFYVVNSSGFKRHTNNEDFKELWSTLISNFTESMK